MHVPYIITYYETWDERLKIETAGWKTRAIFHNRDVCVASEWVIWELTSMWS